MQSGEDGEERLGREENKEKREIGNIGYGNGEWEKGEERGRRGG